MQTLLRNKYWKPETKTCWPNIFYLEQNKSTNDFQLNILNIKNTWTIYSEKSTSLKSIQFTSRK